MSDKSRPVKKQPMDKDVQNRRLLASGEKKWWPQIANIPQPEKYTNRRQQKMKRIRKHQQQPQRQRSSREIALLLEVSPLVYDQY